MEGEQLADRSDPTGEEDGQAAEETEPDPEKEPGPRRGGQDSEDDQQVHAGGGDVGDDAGADLPAESGAVDPGPVPVEPPLVDLTAVDREPPSGDGAVGARGDQRGGAGRPQSPVGREVEPSNHRRAGTHEQAERRPTDRGADHEPGGRRHGRNGPGPAR